MKTLRRLLFLFAGIGLLISCSKSDDMLPIDDPLGSTLKSANNESVMVSVPFKADFSVWDQSDYTDLSCGGYPVFFLTMVGDGNINHLGKMTTRMTFCLDFSTLYYYYTEGIFVAANGDELYATIEYGYIVPNEGDNSSYYQTIFNDPMIFTGGTGRFENASGEAMTNAYVHDGEDEWRTDFFSTGTLILVKGKR
jgi:hypothetical protein